MFCKKSTTQVENGLVWKNSWLIMVLQFQLYQLFIMTLYNIFSTNDSSPILNKN